uniref:HAT C-terminal dimerisation domain-containing protein n=1 Tax=Triticum urartu TaxID=4572 RepID=A0A8R7V3Z2_TRIUA
MLIDIAIESVKGLLSFFKKYRETGFSKALEVAKKIAVEMDIHPEFRTKRKIKRKKQFDEGEDDASIDSQSAEESFRVNYFIRVVDQAITSLTIRFEQYEGYEKIFGFLFTSDRLRSLDDKSLMAACVNLEDALKSGEHTDIDGLELCCELIFIQDLLHKSMGPLDILNYLKKRSTIYPNAVIAYKILLTIPVTVASAERSFSKLKLLKSYLRSTMTQERLNGLATIALENDVLEKIKYEDMIEDFISRN